MRHPQQIAMGEARARFPSLMSPPCPLPGPCQLQREAHQAVPLRFKLPPLSLVSFPFRFLQDRHRPGEHAVGGSMVDRLPRGRSSLPPHLHPHPGVPPAPPRYVALQRLEELGLGLHGTRARLGLASSCMCVVGDVGRGRASSVEIVIPTWISPPRLSSCLLPCSSLAAVGRGRMSHGIFPLQIRRFGSIRIPCLTCSLFPFASRFQDPSGISL